MYVCVNAKHMATAKCSNTEDETVGNTDYLILKKFTVASLIGCGINSSQSFIQRPGGKDGVGVGRVFEHGNHSNHILTHPSPQRHQLLSTVGIPPWKKALLLADCCLLEFC